MVEASSERLFSKRALTGLVSVGLLAFIGFVLLVAFADNFQSGRDGRPHALSTSGVGFRGLVRLVQLSGGEARLLRSDAQLDTEDLLVVALEPQTTSSNLERFFDRRGPRATLIILPKWFTTAEPRHPGWVRRAAVLPGEIAGSALPQISVRSEKRATRMTAVGEDLLRGIEVPVPATPQTVSGGALTPLLRAPSGGILLARLGDEPHYLLADPDLMNNQALKDPTSARAALAILDGLNSTGAQSIAFDLTMNGFGSKPSPLKLPFEPPFLALTIALFVAALLAGLHGIARFGPPAHAQRAIAFGKRALVENSAGLIQLARREHRTGGAYAELIRDSAAHAAGAPPALRGEALDAYLDRLSPADTPKFTDLAERARSAGDRSQLLSAAHALFRWKKDNIR